MVTYTLLRTPMIAPTSAGSRVVEAAKLVGWRGSAAEEAVGGGMEDGKCSPAGVDAAAAGWSHDIPSIRDFMKRTCVAYFATVPEFAEFILQ